MDKPTAARWPSVVGFQTHGLCVVLVLFGHTEHIFTRRKKRGRKSATSMGLLFDCDGQSAATPTAPMTRANLIVMAMRVGAVRVAHFFGDPLSLAAVDLFFRRVFPFFGFPFIFVYFARDALANRHSCNFRGSGGVAKRAPVIATRSTRQRKKQETAPKASGRENQEEQRPRQNSPKRAR